MGQKLKFFEARHMRHMRMKCALYPRILRKEGVDVVKALKILALPKKGGGGSDTCQDFFGGFDTVFPRVITESK